MASVLPRELSYLILKYLNYLQILDQCVKCKDLRNCQKFWYDLSYDNYSITEEQFRGAQSIVNKSSIIHNKIKFDDTCAPYLKYLQLYLQLPNIMGSSYGFAIEIIKRTNLDLIKFVIQLQYRNKAEASEAFIYEAGTTGKIEVVDYFLSLIESSINNSKAKPYQWHLDKALIGAADGGHLSLINHLLNLGAHGNVFNRAAIYDHCEILKEFYNKIHPSKGEIDYALSFVEKDETILFLLSVGADPNIALSKLVDNGNLNQVKSILENNNIEIDRINDFLLKVVIKNHPHMIPYLLSYNPTNIDDAIKYAVRGESVNIVKMLLPLTKLSKQQLFNNATMRDEDECVNIDILEYLYNSDINLNETLIEVSNFISNIEIFKWLLNKGASSIKQAIEAVINGSNQNKDTILDLLIPRVDIKDLQYIFNVLDEDLWELIPIFIQYGINIDKQVELAVEDDNGQLADFLVEGLDLQYQKFKIISSHVNRLQQIQDLSEESKIILSNFTK